MLNGIRVPTRLTHAMLWALLPLFAACGGGGGGSTSSPPIIQPPLPVIEMGIFIDSPVQGLTYQSGANTEGTTDADGMFDYTVGETLRFAVGDVDLGTLTVGKAIVTPNDFGAAAENIARFLQTLDADGIHINGIDLTAAATALANTVLDASAFTADATTFETTIQPILDIALGAGATLIDAETAMANLAAALDSTFDVAELAGAVLIVDLPSENEIGIAVFDPLADPGDTGASVTMFMKSDTINEGGDGTTTELDWSVDATGILSITDPSDQSVITIEKVGGSLGVIALKLTQGAEELVGFFRTPGNGVEMDLTGEDGRSYDLLNASGNTLLSFFPDGFVTLVMGDVISEQEWVLDDSGSLIVIADFVDQISLTVLMSGSLAVGGDTMTFFATNLSGDPSAPVYQLDEMIISSLTPVSFPDPSTAVLYSFSTTGAAASSDPNLEAAFAGATVTGSLNYANWTAPIGVLDGPQLTGAAVYVRTLFNMAGSVAGMDFADPLGWAIVGNDRFAPALVDFLQLASGGVETAFEASGYTLVNVRLIWIEGDPNGTTPDDFLASDHLPEQLPVGLTGRLALDFDLTVDPQIGATVFFEDLTISLAP